MHGAQMATPPTRRSLRQSVRVMHPRLQRLGKEIQKLLPMGVGFFLLSIAQCFSVPSPYAICCLTALLFVKLPVSGAALGLGAGFLFRLLWGIQRDSWQFIACLLCWLLMLFPWQKKGQLYILTGVLLILRALPALIPAPDWQTFLLYGIGILLGLVSMPALLRAGGIMKQKKQELSEDDVLCLMLPGLLLIAGAARLSIWEINLGYWLAALLVLVLSWAAGSAVGICFGMGSGLALLLGGQNAVMMLTLTMGALIAGLFQGKNRLLTGGCFVLSIVTAAYLTTLSLQPFLLLGALLAGIAFALMPPPWTKKISIFVCRLRWARPKENAYTRLKMQRWVRAIDCMADALPHPKMEKIKPEEEAEALTESLCAHCDRLPICWRDEYEATKAGMAALSQRGDDPDGYLPIINQYFTACPRISKIPELLSKLDDARQKRAQRMICADYERDMLQTHLTALSQAAQRISIEGMAPDSEEAYWMGQVEEALAGLRFPGQPAFVKRVDGKLTVCIKCEPLALRRAAGETLARHIGVHLNAPMIITEQQSGRILLEEEPPLQIITGMATACAVTPEKKWKGNRPPDNGDAVLARPLSGGLMMVALSDGMGHGTGAQDESRKTLELLSLCMEAGYTRGQAMTAVNGMMLSATAGEKFATVDLCIINLWTGEAAMNKLGACASMVMQGQKIQIIEGAALPLGIIEHVVPMEHRFTMGEGDVLLLMSDGITDAFAAEEEILAILKRCREDTPQHLAEALLQEAAIRQDGLPEDDMTVLCVQMIQRHPERKRRLAMAEEEKASWKSPSLS